jgi:hypothetical protein
LRIEAEYAELDQPNRSDSLPQHSQTTSVESTPVPDRNNDMTEVVSSFRNPHGAEVGSKWDADIDE